MRTNDFERAERVARPKETCRGAKRNSRRRQLLTFAKQSVKVFLIVVYVHRQYLLGSWSVPDVCTTTDPGCLGVGVGVPLSLARGLSVAGP